jgi:hypothetical protein
MSLVALMPAPVRLAMKATWPASSITGSFIDLIFTPLAAGSSSPTFATSAPHAKMPVPLQTCPAANAWSAIPV